MSSTNFLILAKLEMNRKMLSPASAEANNETDFTEFLDIERTVSCQQQIEDRLTNSLFAGEGIYAFAT